MLLLCLFVLLPRCIAYLANVSTISISSKLNNPTGVSVSSDGLYTLVADQGNHIIQQIILSTSRVLTLAGQHGIPGFNDGIGSHAKFYLPNNVCISPNGEYSLISDYSNNMIRHLTLSTRLVRTIGGTNDGFGSSDGIGTHASFYFPAGVSISMDGLFAIISDSGNHIIRKLIISSEVINTIAGQSGSVGSSNGVGTNVRFYYPNGVTVSPDSAYALIADYYNHLIRRIILSTSQVSTLSGGDSYGSSNGIGTRARYYYPSGIQISSDGLHAFVTDRYNHLIRQIYLPTVRVITLTGMSESSGVTDGIGTNVRFTYPNDISVSPNSEIAVVADSSNNLIRIIQLIDDPTTQPTTSPTYIPSLSPTISSQPPTSHPTSLPSRIFPTESPNESVSFFFPLKKISLVAALMILIVVSGIWWKLKNFPWRGYQRNDDTEEISSSHPLYDPENGIQMSMSPVEYTIVPHID